MDCLVGEKLSAVLYLSYVDSVRRASQSAPFGLCNVAPWEPEQIFCSISNYCTIKEPGVGILWSEFVTGAVGTQWEELQGF